MLDWAINFNFGVIGDVDFDFDFGMIGQSTLTLARSGRRLRLWRDWPIDFNLG
jgi:hypothetical protein